MSAFDAGKPKGVEVTVTTASSGGFAIGGGGGGGRAAASAAASESDRDFAVRMWRTLGDHVRINRDGTCSVRLQEGGGPDLNDAIRLAMLIGGRS